MSSFLNITTLKESSYLVDIKLSRLLVILFLFKALILAGIQQLFKDELVFCVSRRAVARGEAISVRRAPRILRAFGVERSLSGPKALLLFATIVRFGISLLLIASNAMFENTFNQIQIPTASTFTTTAIVPDPLAVGSGNTILLSPFPTSPITEAKVGQLNPFSKTGTIANGFSSFRVREDFRVALNYSTTCIGPPDPMTSQITVFIGSLIHPVNDMAFSEANNNPIVRCLDGSVGSARHIAATFLALGDQQKDQRVQSVELLSLNNSELFSTDTVSATFRTIVTDEKEVKYDGYLTITKRSFIDANVIYSMYGLVRLAKSDEVFRVNIPLYLRGKTPSHGIPCFSNLNWPDYLGMWTFNGSAYICPERIPRWLQRSEHELQSADLWIYPALGVNKSQSSQDAADNRNGDLLAWLTETDYARFVAGETFSSEIASRIRSTRLFYTAIPAEKLVITDGGQREFVQMGRWQTIFFIVSIVVLFLYVLLVMTWSFIQKRRLNLRSEIVSFEAFITMFSLAITTAQESESDQNDAGPRWGKDRMLLGIRNVTGLSDDLDEMQVLGRVREGTAVKRIPTVPLDGQ